MPNNLMVLQDAWHWRKANYWDMPKCATCANSHQVTKPYGVDRYCTNGKNGLFETWVDDSFGCVYHSSIAMPEVLHTPTEPTE